MSLKEGLDLIASSRLNFVSWASKMSINPINASALRKSNLDVLDNSIGLNASIS